MRYCAKMWIYFLGVLILGGCNSAAELYEPFSETALRYNIEVEAAHNKIMFLNVIRASERSPMHFTSISELTRSDTRKRTLGLSIPLGGGTSDNEDASSIGAERSTTPLFKMAVHDSANFYRGILSPLTPRQIQNFIDSGYPPLYVWLLVTEGLDTDSDGIIDIFNNGDEDVADFANRLDNLITRCGLRIVDTNNQRILLSQSSPIREGANKDSSTQQNAIIKWDPAVDAEDQTWCGRVEGRLIPRSPEAMIYFVGQIVRGQKTDVSITIENGEELFIFKGSESTSNDRGNLSVNYRGKKWTIPHSPTENGKVDLSMTTLNFLSLAVGLNKEAKTLQTIDVINLN